MKKYGRILKKEKQKLVIRIIKKSVATVIVFVILNFILNILGYDPNQLTYSGWFVPVIIYYIFTQHFREEDEIIKDAIAESDASEDAK